MELIRTKREKIKQHTSNWCSFRAIQLIYIEFFGQLHDQLCVFWTDFNVSGESEAQKKRNSVHFQSIKSIRIIQL